MQQRASAFSTCLRIFRRAVLALSLGLFIGIAYLAYQPDFRAKTAAPKYERKFNTFAHHILDFEAERFDVPDADYQLLDRIITSVKARTSTAVLVGDPRARERQVKRILQTIDDVLIEERFVFPPQWDTTLSEALNPRVVPMDKLAPYLKDEVNARRRDVILLHADQPVRCIVCQQSALLYVGVAEAAGVELKLVHAPRHIFCRARVDNDRWINWDTNMAQSYTDEGYASSYDIQPAQIKNGLYLSTFADDRTMSLAYHARGSRCLINRRFTEAAEDYTRAVELDPRNALAAASLVSLYAYSPLGVNLDASQKTKMRDLAKAAIALDPRLQPAQRAFAAASAECGDFPSAIAAQQLAINLTEPEDRAEPTKTLWAFNAGQTYLQAKRAENPALFWITYENGWKMCLLAMVAILLFWLIVRVSLTLRTPRARPPGTAVVCDIPTWR